MPGPAIRTDIVDVLVFRRVAADVEFLQLRRVAPPLAGTWQPVMGHVEQGESAAAAALRELAEETGYAVDRGLVGFWQLESLNTYFLAAHDCVILSPGFAAEVDATRQPRLDATHDAHRWVVSTQGASPFLWPGHRHAVTQIQRDILPSDAPTRELLRLDPRRLRP
jgi:8-oxo-dGTP pyrophosphatase MutT (NUDIX family)